MEADRNKWNERYAGSAYLFSLAPSRFLVQALEMVRPLLPGTRALDLACGEGRNAIFLAEHGFTVDAVDIAELGLERARARAGEVGQAVNWICADLENYALDGAYDLIVDFNFLLRPLIPAMVEALTPGGVIIMETILDAPALQGIHTKDFLLRPGELGEIFGGFDGKILLSEEEPALETPLARIIFRKN